MKIYVFQCEDYSEEPVHFTNVHKAMDYVQQIRPGINVSWYQITPTRWYGQANGGHDGFSVTEYELN